MRINSCAAIIRIINWVSLMMISSGFVGPSSRFNALDVNILWGKVKGSGFFSF